MHTIQRNFDIISLNNDLEHLFTLPNFPVFMGCVQQPKQEDLTHDLNFYISAATGMIQLNPVLPLDIVYQSEHNPGTTGQGWLDHHAAFSKFVLKHNPTKVFEIGGAHGILSQYAIDQNPKLEWTIIEPNPVAIPNLKAQMVKGFFDSVKQIPQGTDTIVHSHVLEHVYEPRKFMAMLSLLPQGTKMIFSVPALRAHLQQLFTNTLNFEHTYFCTEEYILWLCKSYGYELIDKHDYNTDHSVFYAFVRTAAVPAPLPLYPDLYQENKTMFMNWVQFHKNLVDSMNLQIRNTNSKVFLFGAHVFSQFLLSFGLDESRIECILDNSQAKQGKRLYGTNLMVHSPKILKQPYIPKVILRSGVFNQEIKQDIINNINHTTLFLE